MKMRKSLTYLAVATVMGFGANAQAVNIDLFATSDAQTIVDLTTADGAIRSNVTASPLSNIIGGERDISVELASTVLPGNGTRMNITGGFLSFSNDSQAGGEGTVQWDGNDLLDNGGLAGNSGSLSLDKDGLGGINLLAVADALIFETISVDLNLEMEIGFYTDDDHFTRAVLFADGPGTTVIPFSDVMNASLCGTDPDGSGPVVSITCGGVGGDQTVDMASFGALEAIFNIDGDQVDLDLTIGSITTSVPEPGTIALLSLGLIGAGFAGSRRPRKNES